MEEIGYDFYKNEESDAIWWVDTLDALWYALMLALTGHFVVHICQSLYIRKYIPSLITSIICLPISIEVLVKCFGYLEFDPLTVVCTIAGIAFMILNLRFAHILMHRFNAKRD